MTIKSASPCRNSPAGQPLFLMKARNNMTKHTKGKWEIGNDGLSIYGNNMFLCRLCDDVAWTDEAQANARVIAAAPDMLEVLEYICNFYSDNIDSMPVSFQTVVNEAEAIINKAKGVI